MKFFESSHGKAIITFVVLGVVGLLILGALGTGSGSYLFNLNNANTSVCPSNNCTGASRIGSPSVDIISGTVVPIIFFVAIVLRLI